MIRDLETAVGLRRGRRRWAAMWVIALVGIVAIACGGDDNPTRVPTAPTVEPTATAQTPTATAQPPATAATETSPAAAATATATASAPTAAPASGDAMMDDGHDDDSMSMAMMAQGHASLAISIASLGDSGQDGVAILVDKGDQTEVVLNISSGAHDVPQPVHIHAGTCDALGGVNHPLTNVVNKHISHHGRCESRQPADR